MLSEKLEFPFSIFVPSVLVLFGLYYCIPQIIDAGEQPIRGTRTHTLLFAFEFRIKSNTFDIFLLAAVFRLWILVIALNSKGFVSTKSI